MEGGCYLSLTPYTLLTSVDGTQINTAFPLATRLATFTFKQNLGILGFQLSSTLTNVDATLLGVFMVVGSNAKQDLIQLTNNANSGLWMSHVSNLNAVPGFASPSSRSSTVGFGESGIHLQAGEAVSLFGCGANDAGVLLTALLNIYAVIST